MYFDKEQWPVLGDDLPQLCMGVINNTVQVVPQKDSVYKVCIRVPSGLFSFSESTLLLSPAELRRKPGSFYLEEVSHELWMFTFTTMALPEPVDLWSYKGLPIWGIRGRCL